MFHTVAKIVIKILYREIVITNTIEPNSPSTPHRQEAMCLSARLRPNTIDEIVGNRHILSLTDGIVGRIYEQSQASHILQSIIITGPPGTGKTSLARLYAKSFDPSYKLIEFKSGQVTVAELNKVIERVAADRAGGLINAHVCLFVDEAHRCTKTQQDRLLSAVEDGTVTLILATTASPYTAIIDGLRSRCLLLTFNALTLEETLQICVRGLNSMLDKLDTSVPLDTCVEPIAIAKIAIAARGDGRKALSLLELSVTTGRITEQSVLLVLSGSAHVDTAMHCTLDQEHVKYEGISGMIKAIRASDPQGAVFYLALLLRASVDPLYIARRLIVSASEDIGLADSQALTVATSCYRATEVIGLPEAHYPLAQTALYLSLAPKSNSAGTALSNAFAAIDNVALSDCLPPEGYKSASGGANYVYPHNYGGYVLESTLPEGFRGHVFYSELSVHRPP